MMNLSKKILAAFGVAAMLAGAVMFTSCGEDDDNDDELIVKENSKTFSIDTTTQTTDTVSGDASTTDGKANEAKRAYITTSFKHHGELVRFTFNNSSEDGGVMGLMWDLSSVKNKTDKDSKRDFWVLGLSTNYISGKVCAYVSKYYNVTDITARNFGATSENSSSTIVPTADGNGTVNSGNPYELIVKNLTNSDNFPIADVSTDKLVIWADIYPTLVAEATHTLGAEDEESKYTGGWTIDFYTGTADSEDLTQLTKIEDKSIKITPEQTGYTAPTADNAKKMPQGYLAVYANVYSNKQLRGQWYLKQDYHADEVVEE